MLESVVRGYSFLKLEVVQSCLRADRASSISRTCPVRSVRLALQHRGRLFGGTIEEPNVSLYERPMFHETDLTSPSPFSCSSEPGKRQVPRSCFDPMAANMPTASPAVRVMAALAQATFRLVQL